MTNGTLTFTSLAQDARSVAHAEVGGRQVYVGFVAGANVAESSSAANTAEDETISGLWTFSQPPAVPIPVLLDVGADRLPFDAVALCRSLNWFRLR